MTKKFRQLSLQAKMSSIFILVNLVVFAVTVILILGINSMSSEIDMVYQGNLRLNELSDALTGSTGMRRQSIMILRPVIPRRNLSQ